MKGKAENRSKTAMSGVKNTGPGQGKYKAKAGNPMDLGLSSREMQEGGSAEKLRQVTNEMEQRPKSSSHKISSDRGSFNCTY